MLVCEKILEHLELYCKDINGSHIVLRRVYTGPQLSGFCQYAAWLTIIASWLGPFFLSGMVFLWRLFVLARSSFIKERWRPTLDVIDNSSFYQAIILHLSAIKSLLTYLLVTWRVISSPPCRRVADTSVWGSSGQPSRSVVPPLVSSTGLALGLSKNCSGSILGITDSIVVYHTGLNNLDTVLSVTITV